MKIGLLHTAASNAPLFEAALRNLGAPEGILRHEVRPDLLAAAQAAGGATQAILLETRRALEALAHGCDGLALTCSTLGEAAEEAEGPFGIPVVGAEAALLREALDGPGPVLILCAAPTTLEPTGARLRALAGAKGVEAPPLRLVEGAWDRFLAGEAETYRAAIRAAVKAGFAEGFASVALAQASMAPAAEGLSHVLTSPEASLREILRRLGYA